MCENNYDNYTSCGKLLRHYQSIFTGMSECYENNKKKNVWIKLDSRTKQGDGRLKLKINFYEGVKISKSKFFNFINIFPSVARSKSPIMTQNVFIDKDYNWRFCILPEYIINLKNQSENLNDLTRTNLLFIESQYSIKLLPKTLQTYIVYQAQCDTLENLPLGLKSLFLVNNIIPGAIPMTKLIGLNNLPSELENLYMSNIFTKNNTLSDLKNLPSGLKSLYFNGSDINLDFLPHSLNDLEISIVEQSKCVYIQNLEYDFSNLPNTLKYLTISVVGEPEHIKLTQLPLNLTYLNLSGCKMNNISTLTKILPNAICVLNTPKNFDENLSEFEKFPHLHTLKLSSYSKNITYVPPQIKKIIIPDNIAINKNYILNSDLVIETFIDCEYWFKESFKNTNNTPRLNFNHPAKELLYSMQFP